MLADGCFDPLHIGHLRYLQQAALLGEVIVRIAPDADILAKGRKPFQTRGERAVTVASLNMVSKVRCDDTLAIAVLSECPQFLVKGGEWRGQLPPDVLTACEEAETEIVFTDTQERSCSERLE